MNIVMKNKRKKQNLDCGFLGYSVPKWTHLLISCEMIVLSNFTEESLSIRAVCVLHDLLV